VVVFILLVIQVLGAIDAILSRYALVLGVDPFAFISIRVALCLPPFFLGSCIVTRRRSSPEASELLDSENFGVSLQEDHESTALSRKRNYRNLTFKQHLCFIFLGLIGVTLFLPLRYYGNLFENASTTGIANAIVPIVTFFMTIICRYEIVTWKKVVGVLISLSGVVVMFTPWDTMHEFAMDTGLIILFLSAICFGIFLSLQKGFLDLFPPSFILARVFGYGSIGIFLVAISRNKIFDTLFELQGGFGGDAMWAWIAIIYSAWGNTVLGYTLYGHAIHLASPLLAGLFVNVQPILINVLAVFFLHEVVPFWKGIGACLIMFGVLIVTLARYYSTEGELEANEETFARPTKDYATTRYAYHYTSPLTIDGIDLDEESNMKNCCYWLCCMNQHRPVVTSSVAGSPGWHHSPKRPLGRLSDRNYVS